MRRSLLALATAVLVLAPLAIVSPADAATPTIGAMDTSTPGHVTGTVTSTTLFVRVALRANVSTYALNDEVMLPVIAGSASYDLETWGLTTGWVAARACDTSDAATCGTTVISAAFTPTDGIVPDVQFPDDSTVGPDDVYQVTASDPNGGGKLVANWDVPASIGNPRTTLTDGAATTIPLDDDGSSYLSILRCSAVDPNVCTPTSVSRALVVNRRFSIQAEHYSGLGRINPVTTPLDAGFATDIAPGHSLTYDWWVTPAYSTDPVAGVGGSGQVIVDAQKKIHLTVDASQLTVNKEYFFRIRLTDQDPDFGTMVGEAMTQFTVDTAPPAIKSVDVSPQSLYPYRDRYRDFTKLIIKRPGDLVRLKIEVLNSAGTAVRTVTDPDNRNVVVGFEWTGRNAAGDIVPAGTYIFRATLTDEAGNVTVNTAGRVKVVRKKLVAKQFTHTYSAASTVEDTFVGRCSVLKRPSNRGWKGSLGYYSNDKCSGTVEASVVSTVHAVRMPAATAYGSLTVTAYGGASRPATRHIAYISYLDNHKDWGTPWLLMPNLGNHAGARVHASDFIFGDRYIVWNVFNVKGSHYDVKSFTVRLGYRVLVPE